MFNCKEVGRVLETISSSVSKCFFFFFFAMEPSGEKKSQAGPDKRDKSSGLQSAGALVSQASAYLGWHR